MARVGPGFVFSIICDLGFAVAVVTHRIPTMSDLIWVAEPTFDEPPDLETVDVIDRWRWPVFFPTGPAVRRKFVNPIGFMDIPQELRSMPRMRGGSRKMGWHEVRFMDGEQVVSVTNDSSLPILQIVNDTRLKEMLVSGYTPEQDW